MATLQVYYMLNDPGISAAVPQAVALYTAGAAGYLRWVLLVVAWSAAGPLVFRLVVDPEPVLAVLSELVQDAALWLAILLLGDGVHSRRGLRPAYRLLEVERSRSEGLLRNMLPTSIAPTDATRRRSLRLDRQLVASTGTVGDAPANAVRELLGHAGVRVPRPLSLADRGGIAWRPRRFM